MIMKEKKKLLVTASTFPRWEGDTEPRFILDLASHMTDEYDVTVLVPAAPGSREWEVLEGVEVIRYHYFPIHRWETLCYPGAIVPRIKEKKIRILLVPFLFLSLYFHLLKLTSKYDVVHAHWLIPQGIVQSFFKKPYIVTGHGGDVMSLNHGVLRYLKVQCLRKAARVSVVAEHLSNKVQELVPGLRPDVISMGVSTANFGKKYCVTNYFGQKDKKVVLFVGRLAEKKGTTYLIEAMRQVDALLVIVGKGPLEEELQRRAAVMKEKILFLGAKNHEELRSIYGSADILVVPSVTAGDGDQEGLPTVIMEAMASELPVVASRSGGIEYLIQDGVTGFLCEERNVQQLVKCINNLLNDQQLCQKIADQARDMIKEYDYNVIAQRYKDILCCH